jgi:glycosyltransferase involved in cell wall biosynthesis
MAQSWFKLERPAFVVLNAARPDPRKNLLRTLEGFAMFAESVNDDVKLCLHHAFEAPDQGCELHEQIACLQLEPYLLWHPDKAQPVSDDTMVKLYNACSVGLNTAHGEGFGLVSLEHAACAVPQILPDQAALREIWGDSAQRLTALDTKTPHSPLMMVDVSAASVATALHRLYSDPIYYHQQATAAWHRSTLSDLDWSGIAQKLQVTLLASL